ncbi:hypothetical protein GCM10009869_02510 [Amnibacterium kyonggiense]
MTSTAPAPAPTAKPEPRAASRLPWWGVVLLIFGASRVVTTVLFLWVWSQATPRSRVKPGGTFLDLVSAWDGQWYWYIAENGYPSTLPLTASGAVDTNQWAFLPVYPYLAKALSLGVVDWRIPALAVSVLAGCGAAVLLAALLLPHVGRDRAVFAAALFSCSPLAFMFQTTYAESLGLLLLLAALLLVDRGRYLAAVPLALVLAFTRPGVLALALAVGLHVLVRVVRARRGGPAFARDDLLAGILLAAVCAIAGFAWSWIAALATGRPDAYFATESAWRALWMPDSSITFFEPWLFAADFWATKVLGSGPAAWVAPVVVLLLVGAFAALLLSPWARRLGITVRLWAASYALYLLAVFFPQSSVFRLLMPMAPLAGAVAPRATSARVLVLLVSLALQGLWLWVCYGPVEDYWTVP